MGAIVVSGRRRMDRRGGGVVGFCKIPGKTTRVGLRRNGVLKKEFEVRRGDIRIDFRGMSQ